MANFGTKNWKKLLTSWLFVALIAFNLLLGTAALAEETVPLPAAVEPAQADSQDTPTPGAGSAEATPVAKESEKVKKEREFYEDVCPASISAYQESGLCPNHRIGCATYVYLKELDKKDLEDYIRKSNFDSNCNFKIDAPGEIARYCDGNLSDPYCFNDPDVEDVVTAEAGSRYQEYYTRYVQTGEAAPYTSEYFNVDDNQQGLTTETQGSRFKEGGNPIVNFIIRLITLLINFIGLATLVVIVVGAYYLLTAAGDDEQISKGKDIIKLGLTGMVIAIFSYAIVTFVQALIY